jgi:transcription antitermination factor NusG
MSGDNKTWYAVYTKSRWEKKVFDVMTREGIEAYCPLNKVRRKWSDRVKLVEEPLFKSYLFVRVPEEEQVRVRKVSGVVNFVYWLGKPAVVRDREIQIIRKFLSDHEEVWAEPLTLQQGAEVTIRHGAFMDRKGKIVKVFNNRVQVVIESIGYRLLALVDRSNLVRAEEY